MRSLATRQSNLALSAHIQEALMVLKAANFDLIILETSGIGQSDTEIIEHSDIDQKFEDDDNKNNELSSMTNVKQGQNPGSRCPYTEKDQEKARRKDLTDEKSRSQCHPNPPNLKIHDSPPFPLNYQWINKIFHCLNLDENNKKKDI